MSQKNSPLPNEVIFNSVTLERFFKFNLYNVNLENFRFDNSKLNFDNIQNCNTLLEDSHEGIAKIDYFNIYEIFRQLKNTFTKNFDSFQALEAHSKMYEYAMKREDLDEWDRFILKMNHWSNRHGTSIGHALKTILIISAASFLLLILSSKGNSDLCLFKRFLDNASDKSTLIFNILNPISRTDEFEKILNGKASLTFFQYLVIYLTKIGIGWGYYQFVAAFRKFGKNG